VEKERGNGDRNQGNQILSLSSGDETITRQYTNAILTLEEERKIGEREPWASLKGLTGGGAHHQDYIPVKLKIKSV